MARSFFVPARNSRHRIAAIALYRALIRSARQVEIPQDAKHPTNTGHPVVQVVRKRFEGNKGYTSLRLVYSSMTAGYKFLTLLKQAQTPNSPEHSQILSFLRKRNDDAALRAAKRNAKSPTPDTSKPDPPKQPNPPLLTRVSGPDETPKYVGTPRTINSPTRQRRVPVLGSDCYGQPFLRYSKPHPLLLDKMVHRRRNDWQDHILQIREVENVLTQEAIWEDQWEVLMDEQLAAENQHSERTKPQGLTDFYLYSTILTKLWSEWRLETMWLDWTARGNAMQKLAEDERVLAEAQKAGVEPPEITTKAPEVEAKLPKHWTGQQNVRIQNHNLTPAVDVAREAVAELRKKGVSTEPRYGDPYSTPVWEGVVNRQRYRMKRRMMEATANESNENQIYKST